jgi:hypothetical protein
MAGQSRWSNKIRRFFSFLFFKLKSNQTKSNPHASI